MTKHTYLPRGFAFAASLSLALSGCALFSKNDPLVPRYFTPEVMPATSHASPNGAQAVRLGRVAGSDHLRERIAYRTKDGELGYHEGLRWTERPEEFVRRALASALFEERGMTRVISGGAPTLEVELIAFEELQRSDKEAVAQVTAVVIVHDGRVVRLERTFTVQEPLGEDGSIHALLQALSRALRACVSEIASGVEVALASSPAEPSPVAVSSPEPVLP